MLDQFLCNLVFAKSADANNAISKLMFSIYIITTISIIRFMTSLLCPRP